MDQLTGADNVSLLAERRNIFNHVGSLVIYDPGTATDGRVRFRDILRHFEHRVHLHPVFHRHLAAVPFDIDRPYWVSDTTVDLGYHLRHIALPKPGDWRQLMIQVARLHSRPLDRSFPLWEAYVIEGLDNIPNLPKGAFAIFLKVHHAAVDGMAAVYLVQQLHALSPEDDVAQLEPRAIVGEPDPNGFEVLTNSVIHNAHRLGRLGRLVGSETMRLLSAGKQPLLDLVQGRFAKIGERLHESFPPLAPVTRFSERVSAHRVLEGLGMPISQIRQIRDTVPGSTLNDVFIAVAGGAVRKYLERKGELPDVSLSGLMPISLRTEGSAGGNQVAGVPVRVCSHIADPIERLRAVRQEAQSSKTQAENIGLGLLKDLFDVLPPVAVNNLLERVIVPRINLTVSNVRGPEQPMYLAGARAVCVYPVSIPADGAGLNFTGVSYDGVLWVSMVSCRNMVPDPGFMLACMREACEELLVAAAPRAKVQLRSRTAPAETEAADSDWRKAPCSH